MTATHDSFTPDPLLTKLDSELAALVDVPQPSGKPTTEASCAVPAPAVEQAAAAFVEAVAAATPPREEQQDTEKLPHRLVDTGNQGWRLGGVSLTDELREAIDRGDQDAVIYTADYDFQRGLEPSSYNQLAETRGPLRPVTWPATAESATIAAAIRAAGRQGAATTAVAVHHAWVQTSKLPSPGISLVLMAGREGSWEAEALKSMVFYSGHDICGKPSRWNPVCATVITNVIVDWVTRPDRFVEVAETLASIFGQAADELHARRTAPPKGIPGWYDVADQYLQPTAKIQSHGESMYFYLMSTARTFDSMISW